MTNRQNVAMVEGRLRAELAACNAQLRGLTREEIVEAVAGVLGSLTGASGDRLLQLRYLERVREAEGGRV